MPHRLDFLRKDIASIKEKNLYRKLKTVKNEQSPYVIIDGKKVILFSSNDYLALSSHPTVKEASCNAIKKYGTGAGASRLICGNNELYNSLEKKIAQFKGVEAALVFSSGYMANLGTIASLCGKNDLILCDRLNHASIIDGCIMSRAKLVRYPHKDTKALEKILKKGKTFRRKLIVTDGLFSMDGDIAPLPKIIAIAKKYSAMVMIDEAHAIGVLGKNGRGVTEYFNITDQENIIIMGTFGKAFGSFGAYITGKKELIDYLINKSRNLIYSTALPPSVLAASEAAINIVEDNPDIIKKLRKNVEYMNNGLLNLGLNTLSSDTHIIPIMIGDAKKTMIMSEKLFECGIFVQGIRPPTVPYGMSRLRITIMASHTSADLDFALNAIKNVSS